MKSFQDLVLIHQNMRQSKQYQSSLKIWRLTVSLNHLLRGEVEEMMTSQLEVLERKDLPSDKELIADFIEDCRLRSFLQALKRHCVKA